MGYDKHYFVVYDREMIDHLDQLNREHAETQRQKNTTQTEVFYRYETFDLPTVPDDRRKRVEMFFAMRWHYVLSQLKNGTSIFLTDVDNIFNQYIDLEEHPDFSNFDIIYAYAGSYPFNVYKKIGFTVCGGCTWLQASPTTIAYVEKIIENCGTGCDDQIIINQMVADGLGIEWDSNNTRKARVGHSTVTGQRVMVMDRDWAYRAGGPETLEFCPPSKDNWINMPVNNATMIKGMHMNRRNVQYFKAANFDYQDKTCKLNYDPKLFSTNENEDGGH